jgi:hypothetical protein
MRCSSVARTHVLVKYIAKKWTVGKGSGRFDCANIEV